MDPEDRALVDLGRWLLAHAYSFTTITPASHARVNARPSNARGHSLRDALGWSRPFPRTSLPSPVVDWLDRAGALDARAGDLVASRVRYSSLDSQLFVHSAFPTDATDAVFFGPDTYRYVALLAREFESSTPSRRFVDVGCGSGAGGLALAARTGASIVLADVEALALRYARVNAEINRVARVDVVHSDVLAGVTGALDAVISNPPYLLDEGARRYRDGGGSRGEGLSVRIARDAMARLNAGGRFVLYTAAPFIDGRDVLREAIEPVLTASDATWRYGEIDPDVFGEELERDAYRDVERIAVVELVATRS